MARPSRRLIVDVLRAEVEGRDLMEDDQGNLLVMAMHKDGGLYQIGMISCSVIYQYPNHINMLISKIKFDS